MVKNELSKEEVCLKALVVADSFDRRFLPVLGESTSLGCLRVANVEILHFTLEWLFQTEARDVIIAAVIERQASIKHIIDYWTNCFNSITLVSCQNCMSVGDVIREVQARSLITSDFLLVANPASFCSFDLRPQIKAFYERRKDKNNVMTLLYTKREGKNPVVCIEKKTNKLIFYHRWDEPSVCDIDKNVFIGDSMVRSDIQDTGIALCSPVICTLFSDNFDFQHRDDIIREILVNEEILCHNIHIDVIPSDVVAFTFSDYEGLIRANTFILQRWLYPLIPGRVGNAKFVAERNNIYFALTDSNIDRNFLSSFNSVGPNVLFGSNCEVHTSVVVRNSSLGDRCVIGEGAVISCSVIGNNVKIGRNVKITEAFIGDFAVIEDHVLIKQKSIIAENVVVASGSIISNRVLCAVECDEEDEIHCISNLSGFEWRFVNGNHFWDSTYKRRSRSESSLAEKDADKDRFVGEGTVEKELNNVEKFFEEVKESMERIAMEESTNDQLIKNLILEINSSKLAYNISMEDVARNVFISFLSLPQNKGFQGLKMMVKKWILLFQNYYKPPKSQIQALIAIEDYLTSSENFKSMTPHVVHLFYELGIFEEEPILEWYSTVNEEAPIKKLVAPIIEWLNTAEEDESD